MSPHLNVSAAAARYRGVQVVTCNPLQLLVMLYDGAIRFIGEAEAAITAGDRARVGDRIGKAHAILEELVATLDRS
jgi:flagellar protein FliS